MTHLEDLQRLGGEIKRLRQKEKMTVEQLSKRSNVSRPTIENFEKSGKNITFKTLQKLVAALNRRLNVKINVHDHD